MSLDSRDLWNVQKLIFWKIIKIVANLLIVSAQNKCNMSQWKSITVMRYFNFLTANCRAIETRRVTFWALTAPNWNNKMRFFTSQSTLYKIFALWKQIFVKPFQLAPYLHLHLPSRQCHLQFIKDFKVVDDNCFVSDIVNVKCLAIFFIGYMPSSSEIIKIVADKHLKEACTQLLFWSCSKQTLYERSVSEMW